MDNTIKDGVRIVSLSTYTSPAIIEKNNKDWIEYGVDNNYYGHLIDMYHGSPTNNRCIKGIADLIYGKGLDAKRSSKNLAGYIELKKLISDDCMRNVAMDLKLLGQCAFQIVKSKDKSRIAKVYHFPMQTIRPEKCNEDGDIEAYYYFYDWTKLKRTSTPKRIVNFELNPEAAESILVVKPYSTGSFYFSPVDYQGGVQYAELETEIANYHINNIMNGLAPSMLINFNNGEPPEETKSLIEASILSKWSGSSNSGKAIISWNDGADNKADITPVPLSDAHNQYQFLSTESQDKVLVSHGITSPLIFGIKNAGNGFSSNSEELNTSMVLFMNMVVKPFQEILCAAVDKILIYQGVSLELYFKSLNPLVNENAPMSQTMSTSFQRFSADFCEHDENAWLSHLETKGEKIDEEEWELISVMAVEDAEEELNLNEHKFFKRFAEPDAKSGDDTGIYKIRYRYAPDSAKSNSRVFCKNMVTNRTQGVIYRREDIVEMGDAGINKQFAPSGKSAYSIWKFKGGVNCHHYWERLTFKRKQVKGAFVPLQPNEIGTTNRDLENYKEVPNATANISGVPFSPPSWNKAKTKPIDMPNKGGLK
jgi:hypothetical protein